MTEQTLQCDQITPKDYRGLSQQAFLEYAAEHLSPYTRKSSIAGGGLPMTPQNVRGFLVIAALCAVAWLITSFPALLFFSTLSLIGYFVMTKMHEKTFFPYLDFCDAVHEHIKQNLQEKYHVYNVQFPHHEVHQEYVHSILGRNAQPAMVTVTLQDDSTHPYVLTFDYDQQELVLQHIHPDPAGLKK